MTKPCRDCPTIADLPQWSYNVATWTQPIRPPFTSVRDIPSPAQAERDLLAALRTNKPGDTMTRITLPITATEAKAVEAAKISGERVFIVREGNQHWKMLPDAPVVVDASPPAEFVQACAPCPEPMCRGGIVQYPEWGGDTRPCPDCRIELVGYDLMLDAVLGHWKSNVRTLGYAYPVGEPKQTDDGKWAIELVVVPLRANYMLVI